MSHYLKQQIAFDHCVFCVCVCVYIPRINEGCEQQRKIKHIIFMKIYDIANICMPVGMNHKYEKHKTSCWSNTKQVDGE